MPKPLFNCTVGLDAAMQLTPPFYFEGVTLRVFPLRANIEDQQRFIDNFLNIAPQSAARFRAFLPYVYFIAVNYGRMSVEAANLGWIAQHEFCFSIPMEWYKVDAAGRWRFHDWAYVSPFIYVDNELSLTTGREVYGWPKTLALMDPETATWMDNPRARPRLVTLSSSAFDKDDPTKRGLRPIIEIDSDAPPSPSEIPSNLYGPFTPWMMMTNTVTSTFSMWRDYYQILVGMGLIRRQPGASPQNWMAMAQQAARMGNLYNPDLYYNTINLKQFRASERPSMACYQALVNARMDAVGFHGGGLLGDFHTLAGDMSGGYRINLHRWDNVPVIESLGLQVDREWQGDGCKVAQLKPVCPFWLELDMRYNRGETLAWRAGLLNWEDETALIRPTVLPKMGVATDEELALYNTTRGAASTEITGPFDFDGVTIRVLPLLTYEEQLWRLCNEYWNRGTIEEAGMRIEPWGRYVYLLAMNVEVMSSQSNSLGWWGGRNVVFAVPVKRMERQPDGTWKLAAVALFPAFAYANNGTASVTLSEVSGVPTLDATIESPPDAWMEPSGPSTATMRSLLSLASDVLPVLREGQQAERRTLVEINDGLILPWNDDDGWRFVGEGWGRRIRDELHRKQEMAAANQEALADARAMAIDVLANSCPIDMITLKQFRDAKQPDRACYQSVVEIERIFDRIYDVREIDSRLHVRIHHYPSQPIVETLGIVAKHVDDTEGHRIYDIEPVRPFWMRVSMHEKLGKTLCRRVGTEEWMRYPLPPTYFQEQPRTSAVVDQRVASGVPQRLRTHIRDFLGESGHEKELLTVDRARAAAETIEPQLIIESALSREWENWGDPIWWSTFVELHREVTDLELRTPIAGLQAAEGQWFQEHIDELTRRRPFVNEAILDEILTKAIPAGALAVQAVMAPGGETAENRLALEAARDNVLRLMAKAQQRPDFFVPRDTLQTEAKDRWFPREASWNDDWYVGGPARRKPSDQQPF